jgi:DtxR family transcriptional regulator, Mn-dependent transcriptional regulator
MRNSLSTPAEDFLLLVHRFHERQEQPTTSGLAQKLGVTDSTVTAMLQRLYHLQLLNYQSRKEISLTNEGRLAAQRLIRRHRLIETYLWVNLGYALGDVHDEAHRLEHVVSDRFVDAVNKSLGYPKLDPHGDPIPDADGAEVQRSLRPLTELTTGESGKLARLLDTRPQTLTYLENLGLYIGARVQMIEVPTADCIRRLQAGTHDITLSEELASQVLVEDIPA